MDSQHHDRLHNHVIILYAKNACTSNQPAVVHLSY